MPGSNPFSADKQNLYRQCIVCGDCDQNKLGQHNLAGLTFTQCSRCYQHMIARSALPPEAIWSPLDDFESIARIHLAQADLLSLMAQSQWILAHALLDCVRRDAPKASDQEPEAIICP